MPWYVIVVYISMGISLFISLAVNAMLIHYLHDATKRLREKNESELS